MLYLVFAESMICRPLHSFSVPHPIDTTCPVHVLCSNDRALLEKCLAATNTRVISNTLRRLLPTDAALFLKAAVDRMLSRPARAAQLAPWIKAVMHHHTGYLMSAPGVQAPMTALYQVRGMDQGGILSRTSGL
jgi:hypothetical protein